MWVLPGAGSSPPGSCSMLSLVPGCSEAKHVENRNGWKNTQQPLWVEGAELWHSSRSVWWKAFLPGEGINGRGATCQRSVWAISMLFSVGCSDTVVCFLGAASGNSPTLGFFLKRKLVPEQEKHETLALKVVWRNLWGYKCSFVYFV